MRATREVGEVLLDIEDRLMARMRTLVAQGIDDEELSALDLCPLLGSDRLHICDVGKPSDPIAYDRECAVI